MMCFYSDTSDLLIYTYTLLTTTEFCTIKQYNLLALKMRTPSPQGHRNKPGQITEQFPHKPPLIFGTQPGRTATLGGQSLDVGKFPDHHGKTAAFLVKLRCSRCQF